MQLVIPVPVGVLRNPGCTGGTGKAFAGLSVYLKQIGVRHCKANKPSRRVNLWRWLSGKTKLCEMKLPVSRKTTRKKESTATSMKRVGNVLHGSE